MSTRSHLKPNPVIVNGDMSGNLTANPTLLQALTIGAYQFSWSGVAPIGNILFQLSNDYSLDSTGKVSNPGTWTTMYVWDPFNSKFINQIPVSGNSGDGLVDFETGANAVRCIYVATSGTGTMLAIISSKVK